MSTSPDEPTEEQLAEMRAAYEAELKRIKVTDVVVQTAVSLLNLGGRRLGLAPGAEDERDLEQVRDAIEAVRGLMPVLEREAPSELGPLRDALAQLQLAYAREAQADASRDQSGSEPEGEGGGSAPPGKGDQESNRPGPAESSGRLWVPGR